MSNMYVMVGVAGSGKSTFVEKQLIPQLNLSTKVISRDKIRFQMVGIDEEYFSKEDAVFEQFIYEIKTSLKENENTIVDATHLNRGSRTKLLRAIGKSLKDVNVYAIVILNDLETILEQNEQREGREYVPRSVIRRMYSQFENPSIEEGFKEIMYYKNNELLYIAGGDWEPQ